MNKKELIIKLIKDDLINNKLIEGLNELGLEASHYHLYLSEVILEMIGFQIDNTNFEQVYQCYSKLASRVNAIDIRKQNGQMDELAEKVYEELFKLKLNF